MCDQYFYMLNFYGYHFSTHSFVLVIELGDYKRTL